MKKFSSILLIAVLLISCATPKKYYVFKYVKFTPRTDKQLIGEIEELKSIPPENLYVSNIPDVIIPNETQQFNNVYQSPVFTKFNENEAIKAKADYISEKYEDVLTGKIRLKIQS